MPHVIPMGNMCSSAMPSNSTVCALHQTLLARYVIINKKTSKCPDCRNVQIAASCIFRKNAEREDEMLHASLRAGPALIWCLDVGKRWSAVPLKGSSGEMDEMPYAKKRITRVRDIWMHQLLFRSPLSSMRLKSTRTCVGDYAVSRKVDRHDSSRKHRFGQTEQTPTRSKYAVTSFWRQATTKSLNLRWHQFPALKRSHASRTNEEWNNSSCWRTRRKFTQKKNGIPQRKISLQQLQHDIQKLRCSKQNLRQLHSTLHCTTFI